jgi:hypothetical protein
MFDDRERVACVEGVLARIAAELDRMPTALPVCHVHRCQCEEITHHRQKVPGIDLVGTRLWWRLFFHAIL